MKDRKEELFPFRLGTRERSENMRRFLNKEKKGVIVGGLCCQKEVVRREYKKK